MEQSWYTPPSGQQEDLLLPFSPPQQPAAPHLRPLSLGEVLDRTFSVYRSRFWLFAGLTAMSSSVQFAGNLLVLLVKHIVIAKFGLRAGTAVASMGVGLVALLYLLPAAVVQAATVYALSEVYLGQGVTAVEAVRSTVKRWYRYVGIAFWVTWSVMWLPLAFIFPGLILLAVLRSSGLAWLGGLLVFLGFCALPYGMWAGLRNSLGVQACVIEGLTVRASMRRSKVLTVGAKWRIVVVGLIVAAISMAASAVEMPLALLILKSPLEEHMVIQTINLTINFLAQTVVTPIGLIGFSLVYFDQRVRQEAFDLLLMLGPEPARPLPPAPLTPAPIPPMEYAEPMVSPAAEPANGAWNDGHI
jgi:hypothetical protein